jgi:hypothetical protein
MPADDRRGNDRPNYIVLYGHVVRGPAARRHESRPCDPARRASCPFIATGGARLGRFDGRRSRTYTHLLCALAVGPLCVWVALGTYSTQCTSACTATGTPGKGTEDLWTCACVRNRVWGRPYERLRACLVGQTGKKKVYAVLVTLNFWNIKYR